MVCSLMVRPQHEYSIPGWVSGGPWLPSVSPAIELTFGYGGVSHPCALGCPRRRLRASDRDQEVGPSLVHEVPWPWVAEAILHRSLPIFILRIWTHWGSNGSNGLVFHHLAATHNRSQHEHDNRQRVDQGQTLRIPLVQEGAELPQQTTIYDRAQSHIKTQPSPILAESPACRMYCSITEVTVWVGGSPEGRRLGLASVADAWLPIRFPPLHGCRTFAAAAPPKSTPLLAAPIRPREMCTSEK